MAGYDMTEHPLVRAAQMAQMARQMRGRGRQTMEDVFGGPKDEGGGQIQPPLDEDGLDPTQMHSPIPEWAKGTPSVLSTHEEPQSRFANTPDQMPSAGISPRQAYEYGSLIPLDSSLPGAEGIEHERRSQRLSMLAQNPHLTDAELPPVNASQYAEFANNRPAFGYMERQASIGGRNALLAERGANDNLKEPQSRFASIPDQMPRQFAPVQWKEPGELASGKPADIQAAGFAPPAAPAQGQTPIPFSHDLAATMGRAGTPDGRRAMDQASQADALFRAENPNTTEHLRNRINRGDQNASNQLWELSGHDRNMYRQILYGQSPEELQAAHAKAQQAQQAAAMGLQREQINEGNRRFNVGAGIEQQKVGIEETKQKINQEFQQKKLALEESGQANDFTIKKLQAEATAKFQAATLALQGRGVDIQEKGQAFQEKQYGENLARQPTVAQAGELTNLNIAEAKRKAGNIPTQGELATEEAQLQTSLIGKTEEDQNKIINIYNTKRAALGLPATKITPDEGTGPEDLAAEARKIGAASPQEAVDSATKAITGRSWVPFARLHSSDQDAVVELINRGVSPKKAAAMVAAAHSAGF